jgi:hypothetical protein
MAKAHSSQQGQIGGFRVGDRVVTDFTVKPPRFASLSGTVVQLNHDAQEIGLSFRPNVNAKTAVDAWFYARELHLQGGAAPLHGPYSASMPEDGE